MSTDSTDKPEAPPEAVPKVPKPPADFKPNPEPDKAPHEGAPIPKGLARQTMRYFIDTRWLEVYNNPGLLTDRRHRRDQSDIFYPTRTLLSNRGYDVSTLKDEVREKLYSYIKEYCEDRLGIRRHEIGIFAADRAVMAYQGELYSVSFENCLQLARAGVDVICIEKEGIVEKLAPFTEGVGIALVQSQGFISEYGIMLAQAAKKGEGEGANVMRGANVMILTDFDTDGIKIAFQLEGITRIGIDFDSVNEINKQLKAELEGKDPFAPADVEPEEPPVDEDEDESKPESIYKPDLEDLDPELGEVDLLDLEELVEGRNTTDTWTSLKYLTQGLERKSKGNHTLVPIKGTRHERDFINYLNQTYRYNGEQGTYLEFLKKNRIELNTIMTQIGAKIFWNWLYSKIISIFPTRNYLRVIPVPPNEITLPVLDKLNEIVGEKIKDCIKDERLVILRELYTVEGFLNTQKKIDEIDDRLNDVVNDDEDITKLNKNLKRLVKSIFKIDVVD